MEKHNFKKKFGQNFLKDENIIKKIVSSSDIEDDSLVIEIGPGAGALTNELLKRTQVLAYEIDIELKERLEARFKDKENFNIIFDDFLKRDVKNDIKEFNYKNLYVIANLPYYITTPILNKLIDEKLNVKKIVIMVQKEVGERFSAKPKTKDYGSITVFLNYFFDIKKLFLVSRTCFIPSPNVDSVILSLDKKEEKLKVNDENKFFKLVKDAFQFKRKTIKNNLSAYNFDKIELVLKKHNLTLSTRAEEIPLEIFIDISNNI